MIFPAHTGQTREAPLLVPFYLAEYRFALHFVNDLVHQTDRMILRYKFISVWRNEMPLVLPVRLVGCFAVSSRFPQG
jgi:hypothetical protein